MRHMKIGLAAVLLTIAVPAAAELSKVQSASEFTGLVTGKTLTRPFVQLTVSPAGAISGVGGAWPITGNWTWENGYFCRSLEWGGDDLGYDCQEVTATAGKITFTSDQGNGDSAEFRLR